MKRVTLKTLRLLFSKLVPCLLNLAKVYHMFDVRLDFGVPFFIFLFSARLQSIKQNFYFIL